MLLNPCFNPWVFVGRHVGVQTIYGTDRRIEVKASAADELMALAEEVSPLAVDPGRTLVVLGTAGGGEGLCRLQAGDYSRRGSPHLEHRGGHAPYHGLHSQ